MSEGKGIVFLQKDKFDFYSTGLLKIIEFRFVPEIIRDLEVVNSDLLESLIKLFVTNNQIAPTELIIVLSDNACFINDFDLPIPVAAQQPQDGTQPASVTPPTLEALGKIEGDIKSFIDHVPFENVQSRSFPMGKGTKVVAVNKDFYETVRNAFEKSGFKVSAVYPGMVFENNIGAKPVMDIVVANTIIQQADLVRDNNLLKVDKSLPPISNTGGKEKEEDKGFTVEESGNQPGKKSNKRLFMMVGVFAVLIIILIFVYMGSLSQTP